MYNETQHVDYILCCCPASIQRHISLTVTLLSTFPTTFSRHVSDPTYRFRILIEENIVIHKEANFDSLPSNFTAVFVTPSDTTQQRARTFARNLYEAPFRIEVVTTKKRFPKVRVQMCTSVLHTLQTLYQLINTTVTGAHEPVAHSP